MLGKLKMQPDDQTHGYSSMIRITNTGINIAKTRMVFLRRFWVNASTTGNPFGGQMYLKLVEGGVLGL